MNRRAFLATAAVPLLAASDRIRIGLIGTGSRCGTLAGFLNSLPGAEIVAVCDVYEPRRLEAAAILGPQAKPTPEYREVLDRNDVDAVVITAPDHWHARMSLDAVAAGKDVYCEKPVTHTLAEGDLLVAGVESSTRVFASGTQQRSWEHYLVGKQTIDSGLLGQITLAQCYWYQNKLARPSEVIDATRLDWKRWLGAAPAQPFDSTIYGRWRYFWDFGGGIFTDLMTHWMDVVQWMMNSPAPSLVQAYGGKHAIAWQECPDTVNAAFQFPNNYTAIYYGTMVGSLEGGGIIFRGSEAMMKLTRDGFAVYREGTLPQELTGLPDPLIVVKSTGDGTRTNLQNWLDCIRSRAMPNAHVRAAVEAARTSHLANQAMREGKTILLDSLSHLTR
jgi:predicted dehydrogenase